jgi:hypothetical protein
VGSIRTFGATLKDTVYRFGTTQVYAALQGLQPQIATIHP